MNCSKYINKIEKNIDYNNIDPNKIYSILKENNVAYECYHKLITYILKKIPNKKQTQKYNALSYYIEELNYFPVLNKEDERKIFKKYQENRNEEIKKFLIEANLKLVINLAKKYINKNNKSLLQDLIEEGNLGLLVAIDKYDVSKNTRFATYASYWIKHYIKSYLYKNITLVKFSGRVYSKYLKYKKYLNKKEKENEKVDREKLKEKLNVDSYTLMLLSSLFNKPKNIEDEIKIKAKNSNIYTKDDSYEKIFKDLMYKRLLKAVDKLDDREKDILNSRYGIFGGDFESFRKIGNRLGISKQRVSQIEKRALEKLEKLLNNLKE